MIKKIILFAFITLITSLTTIIFAQDSDVDSDSLECTNVFNQFSDAFENSKYIEALAKWRICIASCPKVGLNLYINGAKVLSNLIKSETDEQRKQELIDTLMYLYDIRISSFGNEGKVLGYKAEDMLLYQPLKTDDIYSILSKSVTLEGAKSRGGVLSAYFSVATDKYKKHQILKEEAISAYGTSRKYIDENLAKDSTDKFYKKAKKEVDELYNKEFKLNCSELSSLYGPMYESNSTSVPFLRNLESVLKACNCSSFDLYKLVDANLLEYDPTTESLEKKAKEYLAENDLPKAIETYKKAIAKETDASKKAGLYYNLAEATVVNHALSIMYCNNAIETNPSFGKPYILMAKLYAKGANRCGSNDPAIRTFLPKTMYWASTDKCNMAKNLDPKLTQVADSMIAEFQKKYPTKEEIEAQNLKEGDSYKINCWLTSVTTVRAKPTTETQTTEQKTEVNPAVKPESKTTGKNEKKK